MFINPELSTQVQSSRRDVWFNEMVAQLRTDQLLLDTNTATAEKQQQYDLLINGNAEKLLLSQQEKITQHFVSRLLLDFIHLTLPHWPRINQISATANDAEVLMWIELKEEDDLLEDQLTEIEAQVNAQYHNLGYDLDLMIVETEDKLTAPEHYSHIYIANESIPGAPQPS